MGVIYRNTFTSAEGVEWKVDIHDPDYSDTVNTFVTEAPGFTYNYPNDESTRICGSEITIHWQVKILAELQFLISTAHMPEKHYSVVIYRDDARWWVGKIFYNQQIFENDYYPFRFDLKASDYIQMIANEEYNPGNLDFPGQSSVLEHIHNILSKIETLDLYGTNDIFISTINNWHEADHYTTTPEGNDDPLYFTEVNSEAFLNYDDFDDLKSMTCGEVMMELLTRFDLRIAQIDGVFVLAQTNIFEDATYPIRKYNKSLVYQAKDTTINNHAGAGNISTGSTTYFIPALKAVQSGYDYKQGFQKGNLLPPTVAYNTNYALGEIEGGSNERLAFNGVIRLNHTGDPLMLTLFYVAFIFRIRVTVGATVYYLTNESGIMEWSTTSTKRVKLYTDPDLEGTYDWIIDFPLSFISAGIPATGDLEFHYMVELFKPNGDPYSDTSLVASAINFYLNYLYNDGTTQDGYQLWEALNTSGGNSINSEIIEFPDGITGDGVKEFSAGRLRTWDGSQFINSVSWDLRDGDWVDVLSIHQLFCAEMLARRKKPTPILGGELSIDSTKSFAGFHLLTQQFMNEAGSFYDAKWICLMATYDPYNDLAQCEWMLLNIDRTGIEFPDVKVIENTGAVYPTELHRANKYIEPEPEV